MCSIPTALAAASLLIEVGGAAASHAAQNKAHDANAVNAAAAEKQDSLALGLRQQQEQAAGTRDIVEVNRQEQGAIGGVRASASEAGVAGMSVDALVGDVQASAARYRESVTENTTVTLDQLQRMKEGARVQEQNRIAAAPPANWFTTGLKIGGDSVNFLDQLYRRKPKGA